MKWNVLVIRSRHEKKSAALLVEKGIEVFLPLKKTMRQWSDRKKLVDVPLFPGYLFIQFDELKRQEVLFTPGVARFLRYNAQDATIPEQQILAIREAIGEEIEMDITEQDFEVGEDIQVKSGPFRGFYGKVVNYNSRKKILISIDVIGKNILIESGKTRLEKVLISGQNPV